MSDIIDLQKPAYTDTILQFILGDNVARGRIIRLKDSYKTALSSHQYPARINNILGHMGALGLMLSSSIKEEGIFTLQLQAQEENQPIHLMVAEMNNHGRFRLTARYNEEKTIEDHTPITQLFGKNALMAFTTDYKKGERYQGLAPLDKDDLAQAATEWLNNSDQVESLISLRSALNSNNQGELTFGLIIQPLAVQELTDEEQMHHRQIWDNITIFFQSLKDNEALNEDLSLQELLIRLFHEVGIKITQGHQVLFSCRCSQEKFTSSIKNMSKESIISLANDDGLILTKCEYCGKTYDIPLNVII